MLTMVRNGLKGLSWTRMFTHCGHSPFLVKFPEFSSYFPQKHKYLLNQQRYTDRSMCTPEWILWHYWAGSPSNLLNSTHVMFIFYSDYRNCSSTPQANHNFPDSISLTFPWPMSNSLNFPDFQDGWSPCLLSDVFPVTNPPVSTQ